MNYRPICDMWILARPKVKYYGAYPNGFLHRARALLGVGPGDPVLHVCAGKVRDYPGRGFGRVDCTVDLMEQPDTPGHLEWDVRGELPTPADFPLVAGRVLGDKPWCAVLADPPYTLEDAARYGTGATTWPTANALLKRCLEAVRPGGHVGMLHYVLPQPPREGVKFVACVGVIVGYNNRMRCFSVFERTA